MTTLDTSPIIKNDSVYDVVYGYGSVIDTNDSTITAIFNNGRQINYQPGGFVNNIRRLYWHNPVLVAPPKDPVVWNKLVPIIIDVYNLLMLRR